MDRLSIDEITALRNITAAVLQIPPSEVDVEQNVAEETLTATVYGEKYKARCAMDSAPAAMRDYLRQVVLRI